MKRYADPGVARNDAGIQAFGGLLRKVTLAGRAATRMVGQADQVAARRLLAVGAGNR